MKNYNVIKNINYKKISWNFSPNLTSKLLLCIFSIPFIMLDKKHNTNKNINYKKIFWKLSPTFTFKLLLCHLKISATLSLKKLSLNRVRYDKYSKISKRICSGSCWSLYMKRLRNLLRYGSPLKIEEELLSYCKLGWLGR